MFINCVSCEASHRRGDVDLAQACPADTDGCFIWVGLHEPNQELLRTVQQRFGLHDLAIEDALLAHQRPKLEIYGDSIFVALRTAQLVDRKLQFGETHIFAGRGYVVTVRHGCAVTCFSASSGHAGSNAAYACASANDLNSCDLRKL